MKLLPLAAFSLSAGALAWAEEARASTRPRAGWRAAISERLPYEPTAAAQPAPEVPPFLLPNARPREVAADPEIVVLKPYIVEDRRFEGLTKAIAKNEANFTSDKIVAGTGVHRMKFGRNGLLQYRTILWIPIAVGISW
jgi:hypothetical protein